jgi:sacsin
VLGVLERLGMRSRVTRSAVLQSARSIEELAASDAPAAARRARALLRYVDRNADSLLSLPVAAPAAVNSAKTLVMSMLNSASATPHAAPADPAHDLPAELFHEELQRLPWLPALIDPPDPFLPWNAAQCVSPIVSADLARPFEDRLLASSSCRILDGEVHSVALRRLLGWLEPPNLFVLAAQLVAMSALQRPGCTTVSCTADAGLAAEGNTTADAGDAADADNDNAFRKSMALAVPRLYQAMDALLEQTGREGDDDACTVLEQLCEQRCVWVGGEFAAPAATAFNSPLNLAPHLHAVPADLRCFHTLLRKLGVRDRFEASQYLDVLVVLAGRIDGALESASLQMALAIAQQLAAPEHMPLPQRVIFLPDQSGVLTSAHELMYDDAPWLMDGAGTATPGGGVSVPPTAPPAHEWKRVHPKLSHEVADLLGAHSLRRWLVARNADTFTLGLEGVESFGQHESLTSRIRNILELYADGVGIIHELVQNADDAGACRVAFVLDESVRGRSSLLSPAMAAWQGPALYAFNDAQFTPHDFKNICSIGSNAKVASSIATGRFGLGFNATYHFTDVPSIVSGEHVVFFDPHARFLPGATPQNPGLKIRFTGANYLQQFPDQFKAYLMFGCDMASRFDGTLFRFPLRTAETASSSELRQQAYAAHAVRELLESLRGRAAELLLFLKSVRTVEFYEKRGVDEEPQLIFRAQRQPASGQPEATEISQFVRGRPGEARATSKASFYQRLQTADVRKLPMEANRLRVSVSGGSGSIEQMEEWLVCSSLGRGAARICSMCMSEEGQRLKLLPWGGAAARLTQKNTVLDAPAAEVGAMNAGGIGVEERGSNDAEEDGLTGVASIGLGKTTHGRAFCFLPLPAETGLPVHINGEGHAH